MTREARQTEYKGVRFRSKSEAIFARCLDLAECQWRYEPGSYGGHVWDFVVVPREVTVSKAVRVSDRDDASWFHYCGQEALSRPVLVEYKPSRPTRTYYEQLRDSYLGVCDDEEQIVRGKYPEAILVFGSAFEPGLAGHGETYAVWPVWSTYGWYGKGNFRIGEWDEDECSYRHYMVDSMLGITDSMIRRAAKFRFDLCREPLGSAL